jgi:hypothetical protein
MAETEGAPKKGGRLKKILIGLLVVIGGFCVVVALQPSEYRVTRQATMAAPAAPVFEQVNEFRKWQAWSPWEHLDPAMKRSFEGPPAGPGAIYRWTGNSDVGEGSMTILESRAPELVRIELHFIKPFDSKASNEFLFKAEGNQTLVTWTMSGKNDFVGKAFCLFMNMDKMVGADFEKGLAAMKAIVEKK